MAVSWVVFHVTDRCQLSCRHCLRDRGPQRQDIPVDLVRAVLDQARTLYACDHVGLTGGEPTLHPELEAIIDAVVDRDMTWHMITNGHGFDRRVVPLLDERRPREEAITAIDFSLDGADEQTHDQIRGRGSYRQVIKAITMCKMRGLPFMLQMTVNALNHDQVERFALSASHLGAARVSFGFTQATGNELDASLYLSPEQWRACADEIDRLNDALSLPVTRTDGFHDAHPFFECEPFRSEILHVTVDGHLNLCCQHAGVAGHDDRSDRIADLSREPLIEGHRRVLAVTQDFRLDKLRAIEAGTLSDWDHFPCNYCMRYFGKPYWTDGAAAGPISKRTGTSEDRAEVDVPSPEETS